jgi:non-ribosomal peptide synthetase component F
VESILARSYEEAYEQPAGSFRTTNNIAADVCDKHPDAKQAMVFEYLRGNPREVTGASSARSRNRAANVLAAHGVEREDRVAICAPASRDFNAMTTDRSYRRAMSIEAAPAELEANSGSQFDPAVVVVMAEHIGDWFGTTNRHDPRPALASAPV